MGFFQDLKEDYATAVDELLGTEPKYQKEPEMEQEMLDLEGMMAETDITDEISDEAMEETEKVDDMDSEEEMSLESEIIQQTASELAGIEEETELEADDISPDEFEPKFEPDEDAGEEGNNETEDMMDSEEEMDEEDNSLMNNETETEEEIPEMETVEDKNNEKQEMAAPVKAVIPELEQLAGDDASGEPAVSDETAVITSGMKIVGNIKSNGNLDLEGIVVGNIKIAGKANIFGEINGDTHAGNVYADSAQITGAVTAEGSVKVAQSSVIIGDITATSAVIAGAVKGNIDVHGPVILDSTAIVMGDIKSQSVQITSGAVIEGLCSQCYAKVSPASYFEQLEKK